MYHYKILLSKDWSNLINHVVVTNLIEKGSTNFKVKSKGGGKTMDIITDKDIRETVFNLGEYVNGDLKIRIIQKTEISDPILPTLIRVSGVVSYAYTKTSDNREYCPIDIKTGEILNKDMLNRWIEQTMGIKANRIIARGIPKDILSKKITLYNCFYLSVEGDVLNPDLAKKLFFQSVGKRKSYGLGWMDIESR